MAAEGIQLSDAAKTDVAELQVISLQLDVAELSRACEFRNGLTAGV